MAVKPDANSLEDAHSLRKEALSLIGRQRTMVLATTKANLSWAAPVYYVYSRGGFYFFSSPGSRHIADALAGEMSAATIFRDSDQWEQIQGLQMSGRVDEVRKRSRQLSITGRYILKFPFAKPFLQTDDKVKTALNVSAKVRLYVFIPQAVFYLNNRHGFGQRLAVNLN